MSHCSSSVPAVPETVFDVSLAPTPFLNEGIRQRHHTYVANDSRFAASTRLLAHLWRQDQQLPAATFITSDPASKPRRRTANWLLRRDAAQAGATFLTPAIRDHARQALLFREPGAMWNEDRLWANLLSSQALTLNLLAPLAIDLALATRVFRTLLPGFVGDVRSIRFEHSPGRFKASYFGDGTALDALIEVATPEGEIAAIAIEVKLTEGLTGPSATPRTRYVEAAQASGLYRDATNATLARAGFEQLRREHVMMTLMLQHGLASRGRFILIAPQLNRRAQRSPPSTAQNCATQTAPGIRPRSPSATSRWRRSSLPWTRLVPPTSPASSGRATATTLESPGSPCTATILRPRHRLRTLSAPCRRQRVARR